MEMIHDKPSLIGVVIFCQNLEKYKILAVNYKKIIKVVNSGFKEVLDKIEGFFKYFSGFRVLESIVCNFVGFRLLEGFSIIFQVSDY